MRDFNLRRLFSQSDPLPSRPYLLAFIAALSGSIYSVVDK
jgi:hypothetical protein